MDPFSMVTVIVVVSVVGGTVNTALKARMSQGAGRSNAELQALTREVAELRQRVVTLESIVTDPAYELKREIDRLDPARRAA